MDQQGKNEAEFDGYAEDYDAQLNKGLELSGEGKDYFAEGRMRWLRKKLGGHGVQPNTALDFGCGTGSATPFFFDCVGIERLWGVDPSSDSLRVAREKWSSREAVFADGSEDLEEPVDLAFCNGVFHHIPPEERAAALGYVFRNLKGGGFFAFWENNPWNPVTRYAMGKVPFDDDAIMLWPGEARRRLRSAGFDLLGTDFVFYFPAFLKFLRSMEPMLCKIPFGGQYLVLGRKKNGL
jgi:SAM-dependent methyltransferase